MKYRLLLIMVGIVFFANPAYNLFDILPDFIGALLIMTGLSGMKYFDGNFEGARNSAKAFMWISVVKLVLCVWTKNGHFDYVMPFTFACGVMEVIFMIGFFRNLYLGAEYTLMRSGYEGKYKELNEGFTMSFIFTFALKFLDFAPHITDILAQDAELDLSHNASYKAPMAFYKVYITLFALVCGVILGVVFVAITARAWIKLMKSKEYCRHLENKLSEFKETERDKFMADKIGKVYFLLTFGVFFIFDFCIDGVNYIPSFMGVLLIFWALAATNKLDGSKIKVFPVIFALVTSVLNLVYMTKLRMGINYEIASYTYNRKEFAFLSNPGSVAVTAVLSLVELAAFIVLVNGCINSMKSLFKKERRNVAVPMLNVTRVTVFLSASMMAAAKICTSLMGFLVCNDAVNDYASGKTYLSEGLLKTLRENRLVALYEDVNTVGYVFVISALVLVLFSILYLLRMRRFTDG